MVPVVPLHAFRYKINFFAFVLYFCFIGEVQQENSGPLRSAWEIFMVKAMASASLGIMGVAI